MELESLVLTRRQSLSQSSYREATRNIANPLGPLTSLKITPLSTKDYRD